jgi:hypothetical protein
MRAPPLILALSVLAAAATPQVVRAQQIGIQGGFNRAGIQGDAPPNAQYAGGFGYMAGIVFDLPIATDVFLSVQPMYARRGTGIAFAVEGEEEPRDSLDVALTYLSVPLLAKVQAARGRTYVTGGVDVGWLLDATLTGRGADEDIASAFKDLDVAALFGFGVVFPLGAPRITVEARYSQSLLNLSAGGEGPGGAELPDRFRANGFQLLTGLVIPLGGR